jgi:hypothetical protein
VDKSVNHPQAALKWALPKKSYTSSNKISFSTDRSGAFKFSWKTSFRRKQAHFVQIRKYFRFHVIYRFTFFVIPYRVAKRIGFAKFCYMHSLTYNMWIRKCIECRISHLCFVFLYNSQNYRTFLADFQVGLHSGKNSGF